MNTKVYKDPEKSGYNDTMIQLEYGQVYDTAFNNLRKQNT